MGFIKAELHLACHPLFDSVHMLSENRWVNVAVLSAGGRHVYLPNSAASALSRGSLIA